MQKEKTEPTTTTSATTTTKSTTTTTTDTTERYSKLKIINSYSCKKKIFSSNSRKYDCFHFIYYLIKGFIHSLCK